MSEIITSLTPGQIALMADYRDRWIAIGRETKPANRPLAEQGIQEAYKIAGLDVPKVVWVTSPLVGGITLAILKQIPDMRASVRASVRDSVRDSVGASVRASVRDSVGDSVRASVRASVRDSVGDSVGDSVRDSVWDSVRDSVRDSVGDSVWASVRDSVGDSVRDSVRDSVWASVRDSVWDSVWDSVYEAGYGQHDANWLAFYEYFRHVCQLTDQTDKLIGLTNIAKSANWFWPRKRLVLISERHNVLGFDADNRLHSATGPAVGYSDGWGVWAWHGVRVSQDVIENPETITVAQIESESNAEVRRVLMERYGYDRYLSDSGAVEVATDDTGVLLRKDVRNDEPLVMVKVVNSTPEPDGTFKSYMIRVPPTTQTPKEAIAWTFGLKAKDYRPLVQS